MKLSSGTCRSALFGLAISAVAIPLILAISGCGGGNTAAPAHIDWKGDDSGYKGTTQISPDGKMTNKPLN